VIVTDFLDDPDVVQPMKNRLLVERIPEPDKLIILTDIQTVRWARVLAVGPKVTEVNVGEIVMLPGVAASEPDFEIGDKLFVQEGDVGFKLA
jgi:hypothetical protein